MEHAFQPVPVDFMVALESVQHVQLVAKPAMQPRALHALLDYIYLRASVFQVVQLVITYQLVYAQLAPVAARTAQLLLGAWLAPQL